MIKSKIDDSKNSARLIYHNWNSAWTDWLVGMTTWTGGTLIYQWWISENSAGIDRQIDLTNMNRSTVLIVSGTITNINNNVFLKTHI